jgi:hypothetical protein
MTMPAHFNQSGILSRFLKLCDLGNLGVDFCPRRHFNRKNRPEDAPGCAKLVDCPLFDGFGFFSYKGITAARSRPGSPT